jgi:glycerol kinase
MGYILSLDQGTTSSRALLVSESGEVRVSAQKEIRQIFPSPGLVEHDPFELWSSLASCIEEVLAKGAVPPSQIGAVGIANQRETTLVWDRRTGKPLMNAIVWQDRRTADLCEQFKQQGLESSFRGKTGLLLDPYFSGTKLHWILNTIPGAAERAKTGELAFGTVDTWILWQLTEGRCHATDVTNASRTLLFNIHTRRWDEELLSLLEIPPAVLPEVHPSSHSFGVSTHPVLPNSVPIAGIAGDQQAALVGQACFKPGMVKSTYGTGCFLLMNTGSEPVRSDHHLLTTIGYQVGSDIAYALEGSVFMGGAVVQWLRDQLHLIKETSDIEALAESVPDSGGTYFVPAFTGLGAPYWDPHARGIIVGLTRGTEAGHLARSALESIALQVADLLQAMEGDAGKKINEIRVDGGAVSNGMLMQFQADLMAVPVVRPDVRELTAQGAAYLAGIETGVWKNLDEVASLWREEHRFSPQMPEERRARIRRNWSAAIRCAQSWEAT